MDKGFKETSEKDLANKMYEVEDYTSTDSMAQGLAITHEQVSDYYIEGTVGAVDERDSDEDQQIPRKG